MKIEKNAAEDILKHAERDYPREACGLLIGSAEKVELAFETQNLKAGETNDRYLIKPENYLEADRVAQEKGMEIVGCYHSHPDWPAHPSKTDLKDSWPDYIYVIVSTRKGKPAEMKAWRLDESEEGFDEIDIDMDGE